MRVKLVSFSDGDISQYMYLLYSAIYLIHFLLPDIYRETIPSDAPPSYRGQAVKYSYKITIGTQRVNTAIQLLRVPFRVLSLSGKF